MQQADDNHKPSLGHVGIMIYVYLCIYVFTIISDPHIARRLFLIASAVLLHIFRYFFRNKKIEKSYIYIILQT